MSDDDYEYNEIDYDPDAEEGAGHKKSRMDAYEDLGADGDYGALDDDDDDYGNLSDGNLPFLTLFGHACNCFLVVQFSPSPRLVSFRSVVYRHKLERIK